MSPLETSECTLMGFNKQGKSYQILVRKYRKKKADCQEEQAAEIDTFIHASQVLRTQRSLIREDSCHILTVLAVITLSHYEFHCSLP